MQGGATLTARSVLLERNRAIGLVAIDPGSRVEVTDLAVVDTLERECVETHCAGFGGGVGIGAYSLGAVEIARFLVSGSALAGVQVASATDPVTLETLPGPGEMDLHEGEVSGSPVGANVQAEGYDFGRLTDRVVYRDNGRNLDSETLPVPSAALPAGGP